MSVELDKVKAKILALSRKTLSNGCSQAEAMSAAEKVGELLDAYNLTMDEVTLSKEKCISKIFHMKIKRQHPISPCIVRIAEYCDCKCWFEKHSTNPGYGFFGLEQDVELAYYLCLVIYFAMEFELNMFKMSSDYIEATTHRKRLSVSFQHGMANAICQKLKQLKNERDNVRQTNAVAITESSTAIVHLKKKKVEEEFEKVHGRMRSSGTTYRRSTSYDSYYKGVAAGRNVNLNRPLKEGPRSSNTKLIGG